MDSRMITAALGIMKLILGPIAFSHLVACGLWGLGRMRIGGDPDARSWIHVAFKDREDGIDLLHDVEVQEQYTASLYFAVTIVSTVGFGDIVAPSSIERLLVMSVMMVASAMVGV